MLFVITTCNYRANTLLYDTYMAKLGDFGFAIELPQLSHGIIRSEGYYNLIWYMTVDLAFPHRTRMSSKSSKNFSKFYSKFHFMFRCTGGVSL